MNVTESDPIVITGMAVEAPGGIDNLAKFWQVVSEGKECISPFPRDRDWPIEALLNIDTQAGFSEIPDAGGFLLDADKFDSIHFGISPREAVAMDPQQRVALRVAWKAIENTGLNPSSIKEQNAGCFIGVSINEYGPSLASITEYTGHRGLGSALGATSGRISSCFGIVGPTLSIDNACASSITALHLAANSLRNNECEWALVGGVCVMGTPYPFLEFSKIHALSTDGHCKPYSAQASGTLWGEAAGMVILEKESKAIAKQHNIYGYILGSGISHVGSRSHIAAPSLEAQSDLIMSTLSKAGLAREKIDFIEGHGTGTKVGDPIELQALQNTYACFPKSPQKVYLGSVKGNFGHTQAASGIIGIIKMLLCGFYGELAPSLYAENPTNEIDWNQSNLELVVERKPWNSDSDLLYGAVSSYGLTGVNAHLIVGMPNIKGQL